MFCLRQYHGLFGISVKISLLRNRTVLKLGYGDLSMNPSIIMTETISNLMPYITMGIVVVGGICMGIYHIITFDSHKKSQSQQK